MSSEDSAAAGSNEEELADSLSALGATPASTPHLAAARALLDSWWEATEGALRRAHESARTRWWPPQGRIDTDALSPYAVQAAVLAAVFALVSLMILVFEQLMPPWRAALVTSGLMTVLGVSLLAKQAISQDSSPTLARLRTLRIPAPRRRSR